MTTATALSCPKCRADLKDQLAPLGAPQACPACRRALEGVVFPAFYQSPVAGKTAEALIAAEEAGCFYHPQNRGQVPCDYCGRFLCSLCDVELSGQHFCPACVNAGRKKKRIKTLESDRLLYGGVASMIALLPMLVFWPITFITGPLAVFVAVYGWRKPQSLTGVRRASYVVAIIFGLIQFIVWLLLTMRLFKYF